MLLSKSVFVYPPQGLPVTASYTTANEMLSLRVSELILHLLTMHKYLHIS